MERQCAPQYVSKTTSNAPLGLVLCPDCAFPSLKGLFIAPFSLKGPDLLPHPGGPAVSAHQHLPLVRVAPPGDACGGGRELQRGERHRTGAPRVNQRVLHRRDHRWDVAKIPPRLRHLLPPLDDPPQHWDHAARGLGLSQYEDIRQDQRGPKD